MTTWKDRTLEQQTAYVRKTYSRSPIRTLEGRILHEQTPNDVEYAEAQFDQWLAAVTQPQGCTAVSYSTVPAARALPCVQGRVGEVDHHVLYGHDCTPNRLRTDASTASPTTGPHCSSSGWANRVPQVVRLATEAEASAEHGISGVQS